MIITLLLITAILTQKHSSHASGMAYYEGIIELPGVSVKISRFFRGGYMSADKKWSITSMSFNITAKEGHEIYSNGYLLYLGKKHYFRQKNHKWIQAAYVYEKYNQTKSDEYRQKGYDSRKATFVYSYRKDDGKSIKVYKSVQLKLIYVGNMPKLKGK